VVLKHCYLYPSISIRRDGMQEEPVKEELMCPKCKSSEFSIIKSRFNWLRGYKFRCGKCGTEFRGNL
jgi:Zn finger protein HypA/HybF involved in hydrogenase expression